MLRAIFTVIFFLFLQSNLFSSTFDELKKNKKINFYKSKNGLEFWSFNMKDFYNVSVKFFNNNIYNYLEKPLNLSMDI